MSKNANGWCIQSNMKVNHKWEIVKFGEFTTVIQWIVMNIYSNVEAVYPPYQVQILCKCEWVIDGGYDEIEVVNPSYAMSQ